MRSFNDYTVSRGARSDLFLRPADPASESGPTTDASRDGLTVLMLIRVATSRLTAARHALHQLLGPDFGIYIAVIDNRRGYASLQIELAAQRVEDAMTRIMHALPEAEFGTIRPSRRGRDGHPPRAAR